MPFVPFTAVRRPGSLTSPKWGTTARLARNAAPSTVLTMAAPHPMSEMRAARLPVASKKTGLFAMLPEPALPDAPYPEYLYKK